MQTSKDIFAPEFLLHFDHIAGVNTRPLVHAGGKAASPRAGLVATWLNST